MFTGEYTQKMDTKGRTIVPAKFREELGTSVVVTRGLDGCLFAYSKEAWHALEEKLSSLPFADRKVRDFNRFFLAGASELETDKLGRVLMPAVLRKFGNLDKEVVWVGVGVWLGFGGWWGAVVVEVFCFVSCVLLVFVVFVSFYDFLVSDRMITFTDARGVLMALKPDVTLSIIKNTRENEPGPRKVYYNETVYRSGKGDEGFQEIMQTGLECIGELDLYHIYEVTALAVRSLAAISPDYVLDVSHVGLVSGFMEAAGVAEEDYPEVMAAVRSKNLAALDSFCHLCFIQIRNI